MYYILNQHNNDGKFFTVRKIEGWWRLWEHNNRSTWCIRQKICSNKSYLHTTRTMAGWEDLWYWNMYIHFPIVEIILFVLSYSVGSISDLFVCFVSVLGFVTLICCRSCIREKCWTYLFSIDSIKSNVSKFTLQHCSGSSDYQGHLIIITF